MSNTNFGEQFLEYPELFPARAGGDAWGDESVLVDFIGGPYLFSGLSRNQAEEIRTRYGDLCMEEASDDGHTIRIRVYKAPVQEYRDFEKHSWEMDFDFDYTPDYINMAGLRLMARISLHPDISAAMWTPDDEETLTASTYENVFRTVVAYRIIELGGVLLHSAGMTDGKDAWLFIGRSNAGKTTISRLGLDAGLHVLSDDMNALIPDGKKGFVSEQLPFAGDLGQTAGTRERYPVRAIHQLHKGKANHIDNIDSAEYLAMLLVCTPFVNTNPYYYAKVLSNLSQLRSQVQGAHITFDINGGFEKLLSR